VIFSNIIAESEHGIILYGDAPRSISDIVFNQVKLKVKPGKETMTYGGNFDLRPAADIDKQLFQHDIPGLFALNVDDLDLSDFHLEWGEGLPDFFTHAIELEYVSGFSLTNFKGNANPGSGISNAIKNNVDMEKGLSGETREINIVMLGNSITHQGNWAELLVRQDILNGGQPGWTTQQLSWVIKDFIIPNNPKVCFFKAGINDYTLGISTDRIHKNICENLDSISNVGTHPVFQTTLYQRGNTKVNREIDKLNKKVISFCEERGYDVVDLRPYLCKDGDILDEFVKPDNTHLEPAAYKEWVKALRPVLKKYGLE
jgi:lysophospholipase L1-like esterase